MLAIIAPSIALRLPFCTHFNRHYF